MTARDFFLSFFFFNSTEKKTENVYRPWDWMLIEKGELKDRGKESR